MRHYVQLAIATSLLLTTAACATPSVNQVGTAPVAVTAGAAKLAASRQIVAEAIAQATSPVVKDMGVQDGAAVAVTIDVASAQRSVQALQHRWITSDVHTYAVSLQVKNPDASFSEVAALSINAASYNTSTTGAKALAAFTGLVANKQYKVTVQAWGSNPITPATAANQQLNVQNPVEANFDFRETSGTIETAPPAQNLAVVLDSFVFNGSAAVNTTLTEGTFLPAPGGIKAEAVLPPDGFYRVSNNEDKVRPGSFVPDGINDKHLRWVVTFAAPIAITKIHASFIWGGYNTSAVGQFLVGIFTGPTTHFPDPSLPGFAAAMPQNFAAGRYAFEVYLPSAVGGDHEIGDVSIRYETSAGLGPIVTTGPL